MGKATEKQGSKEKITDIALELFANQGFHKTSISQIANQAGVSKSLIYNYFDSKDHLLEYILKSSLDRNLALLPEGGFEALTHVDDLMNYMQNIMADLQSNPAYYRLLILLTLQGSVKQKVMDDVKQVQEQYMPVLLNIFQNHGLDDPEKMTFLFSALFDGLVLHYLYMEEDYPIDDLLPYFVNQFKSLIS